MFHFLFSEVPSESVDIAQWEFAWPNLVPPNIEARSEGSITEAFRYFFTEYEDLAEILDPKFDLKRSYAE